MITEYKYFDYGINQLLPDAFGLLNVDLNRFVYVSSDYHKINQLAKIAKRFVVVDLNKIEGYSPGLIDNSVCINWGLDCLQQATTVPIEILHQNIRYSREPNKAYQLFEQQEHNDIAEYQLMKLLYISFVLSRFLLVEQMYYSVNFEWALSRTLMPADLFEIEEELNNQRNSKLEELYAEVLKDLSTFFADESSTTEFKTTFLDKLSKSLYRVNFQSIFHPLYRYFPIHEFGN